MESSCASSVTIKHHVRQAAFEFFLELPCNSKLQVMKHGEMLPTKHEKVYSFLTGNQTLIEKRKGIK